MNIVVVKSASVCEDDASREAMPEVAAAATAQAVSEALADEGHVVAICNADARLAAVLSRLAPDAFEGRPAVMAFNLARTGSGDAPRAQIPALLELAGVPYTGPSALGHAVGFDVLLLRTLLKEAGVTVTPWEVVRWAGHEPRVSRFPAVVAPRYRRPGGRQWLVQSRHELREAVERILNADEQEAIVCEHDAGVELTCGLLGNGDDLELLPIVERHEGDPADRGRVSALALTPVGQRVGAIAAAAFKAVHCQDYARVIVRLDRRGYPAVVDVDSMPRIDRDSNLVLAGDAGGYGHARLVSRILDTAHRRYFGTSAPRFDVTPRRDRPKAPLRLIG